MTRFLFSLAFFMIGVLPATARQGPVNFVVKENLLKNQQIAVIAAGKNDVPTDTVNGTYTFSINGFDRELAFHDGIAVVKERIAKSTFIYLKYESPAEAVSRLYYVRVSGNDLNPVHISWIALLLIPGVLILAAFLFRKLILYAVILLIAWFYFNNSHGLDTGLFFKTIADGLGNIF